MPPPSSLRFVTDRSLGGLARWLRILGFDTQFASDLSDAAAIAAAKTGRILVTRTGALRRRTDLPRVVFVSADRTLGQLREVVDALSIRPADLAPFSRCASCNRRLKSVPKADVFGRAPEYVWHAHERFSACPECGRVFWAGSHQGRMRELISGLFSPNGGGAEKSPWSMSPRRNG
jgi:hypothetical protein